MSSPAAVRRVVAHNGASVLGGGEIAAGRLLAGLQRRGYEVHILCRDPRIAGRIADLTGVEASTLRIGGALMVHDAVRFAAALRRLAPDALILTTFKKVPIASLGARLARVPTVIQRIGLSGDVPRGPAYRFAFRHLVDVVALNAESLRAEFLAGDGRLPGEKIVTIQDGVATPERTRSHGAFRDEIGIPRSARVVGSVARLAGQKRFDRLLRAAVKLPSDVHVLIVGDGEERSALLSLAAELGISQRVHLPGFRADVGDVLDAIDVFAVTSDREGLANAMLEAMAAGVPCVSTEVSGAREVLLPAGRVPAGVVVEQDISAITTAVSRLLNDEDERRRVGEAGRARFLEQFSLDRMLDEWEALLNSGAPRSA